MFELLFCVGVIGILELVGWICLIVVGIFRFFYLLVMFLCWEVSVFKNKLIVKNNVVRIFVVWVIKLFEFDELKMVFVLLVLNDVFMLVFLFCWININLINRSVIIRYVINNIW